jgi:KipI family sensor histidine kinase inhibitor
MKGVAIYALGETAIVCAAAAPATLACQRRVWAVARAARDWPAVVETVPGMNNLTLIVDPLAADFNQLQARLAQAWDAAADIGGALGRPVEIPVRYGGSDGPDLGDAARYLSLSAEALAERHAGGDYAVFFVGFQPGFAYLGGLDPRLALPRRASPRQKVPAGSVAIGGAQTGVYPVSSPGGWQLIGRTDAVLFDAARAAPALLGPGDRVRFVVTAVTA